MTSRSSAGKGNDNNANHNISCLTGSAVEQVRGRRAASVERTRTPSLERQRREFRQSQFAPPPAWPPVQSVPARGVALQQGQLARMQDPVYAAGIDEARRAQERPTSFIRRSSPAPGQQTTNFSYPLHRRTSASPAPGARRTSASPGPGPRNPSPSKRG